MAEASSSSSYNSYWTKQPLGAFGTLAEAVPLELSDLQLEVGDQSCVAGDLGLRGSRSRLGCG